MPNGDSRLSLLAQERSRRTHRTLIEVALRLWAARGFDEVPVSDICDEAGVAKGTFYFYFARKEDLLIELGLSALDPIMEATEKALSKGDRPVRAALDLAVDGIAAWCEQIERPMLRRMIEETLAAVDRYADLRGEHAGYGEIFSLVFAAANDRGELPGHYQAPELASVLSWAALQAVHNWSIDGSGSLRKILRRRARLVWNGATIPPG